MPASPHLHDTAPDEHDSHPAPGEHGPEDRTEACPCLVPCCLSGTAPHLGDRASADARGPEARSNPLFETSATGARSLAYLLPWALAPPLVLPF